MRAKFFDECRVLGRIGPRQIHFTNDGATGYSISVRIRRGNRELNTKKKARAEMKRIMAFMSKTGAISDPADARAKFTARG